MSPPTNAAGERRPKATANEGLSAAAEAALRLAAIVESSEDAIISKDLRGIIETWNAAAERIFGYTAAEAIGKPILILIPPERRHEEDEILEKIRRGVRVDHFETIRRNKRGLDVEVSLTISPIKDESGRIIGASKIARDIGDKKRAERALKEAHQAVLAASQAKDDFLAALSHELRTPLNPVLLLASSAAEDPGLPDAVRQDFADIRRHVEVEARLIDDLLDITRITHGKLPLALADVDLHALIREVTASIKDDLVAKRINFAEELHAVSTVTVGDAARLRQILWNVLNNAVKFTPAGGRIEVASRNDAEARHVVVLVSDSGIGINDEEKKRLFSPFSQGDHASKGGSHHFGGLGLGLTIARMLVELHQGTISAESAGRHKGSTFTLTLPASGTAAQPAARTRIGRPAVTGERNGKQLCVLLVEDHSSTRSVIERLLRRRKFHVLSAQDAESGLQLFAANEIDLVISDIGLPGASGLDLMVKLLSMRRIPGIALTGFGMENDLARTVGAGFAAHLTKPISIEALEQAIAAVLKV